MRVSLKKTQKIKPLKKIPETDAIFDHAHQHPDVEELAINLDNGPSVQSHRTQFIRRMVEFSHKTGLRIVLIYYPPYHTALWRKLVSKFTMGRLLSRIAASHSTGSNR